MVATMHIVHGTWIPDETTEFVRPGGFYLWVETDRPTRARSHGEGKVHPRHLADAALAAFLKEKLDIENTFVRKLTNAFSAKYFLLPSVNDQPLPSFELLHYVEEEIPEEFGLASWQVCCYQVANLIATLNGVHFVALHAAEDFQLGTDLVFWYQYSQVLRQIIAKDRYIPALKYHELVPSNGKGGANASRFEVLPGWEIVSDTYETAIRRYVASMPAVCVAGSANPENSETFAKSSLLHHFSECLLQEIVTGTPFPAKFDQQISDTLLYDCIYPYRPRSRARDDNALTEYRQWAGWRQKLTQAQTASSFNLCFRLEDALASDPDQWRIHFLVAAKHDPSLKLSLADYWRLNSNAKREAARPFGSDFEKNLLLALGYAARVYPKVWEGLETDQPIGFHLTLDEAFAFLKESAWVLEDAGYTVIVPAWWTPDGRRRAKIRLKTAARPTK